MAASKKPKAASGKRHREAAAKAKNAGSQPPAGVSAASAGQSCPIIGFGASAGGLEAMTEVLHSLPAPLGAAIVFIQHLDPKHSSMLTELLARATHLPVCQVTDGMQVESDHLYVIAPNTCIGIRQGHLISEARNPVVPHMPIDFFFRSLAEDQGSKAIGVVLSGTASDGTLGLKAIKEAGGFTIAQEPETARYDGMPRSAIVAGCVDSVLPARGIAAELVRLCQHPYMDRRRPDDQAPPDERTFEEILGLLRTAKGVDFAQYKPGTVQRRTLRRMAIHRIETPEQYARYLKGHREEVDLLFQDILIHVTSFFREPATFSAIASHVLPALLKGRSQDDPLRIWVPGCATGEEAYSVAICVLEYMRQTGVEIAVQIFGTDLSETALEQARSGLYPQSIEADLSPERLRRFFISTNGKYQIARSVRDVCIFARQNVTKDPPFSRIDLITCRNLLIYLGQRIQGKVIRLFHYALKPTGNLVLGASENVGEAGSELFIPVDRQHKIYARKPARALIDTDLSAFEERARNAPPAPPAPAATETEKRIDQLILAHYSPPSVVVDSDMKILQFRGDTMPYLRHLPGSATLNFTRLARGNLGAAARALFLSRESKTGPVKSKPISVAVDGGEKKVVLSVLPLTGAPDPQFVIAFETVEPEIHLPSPKRSPKPAAPPQRVADLQEELATTKRYLHSVIQQQEAATEELKSAHEEVQSSNEELQSTNEELLTAKEELQSTNEELTTLNHEMQSRNAELQQINNDLINLLSSVNIPIVMLDNDLQIRRFTPHAERILNLLPADIGRSVNDFRFKINVSDIIGLCHEVIDSLAPREREVQDADGHVYTMWLRPYRTADNRIDGVVLSLFDITERKQSAEARYRRLFEASRDGIVIADVATGEIVDSNPFVTRLLGHSRSRLIGAKFWESDLFRGSEMNQSLLEQLHDAESLQKTLTLTTQQGEQAHVDIVATLYTEAERRVIQFSIRDVSARKRVEDQTQRQQEQLREMQKMEAVGRLAGGVAHDFNNILTAITGFAVLLEERLVQDPKGMEMLHQVRNGADRAAAITRQLMAFGRRQIFTPTLLDLNTVIAEFRQMLAVMLPRNVQLEIRPGENLGLVMADRTQVEQVILNLALNARDAMPEGGTIRVSASNLNADAAFAESHPTVPVGQFVALMVQDTGTGMDPQTQARIFEPFFTTKPKGSGAGLGLATVYSIVNQSGGYIRAYSELGVGSTFTVYLPRVNGEVADQSLAEPGDDVTQGTETILLVEDQNPVRELVRRFLEMAGYRVLEAGGGPEALGISREHAGPIDLMVTDVVMPRMSGRELALQLASERPQMKVLYMSGHTEDAIVHHGVLDEGVELLHKPFSQRDLLLRVRRILDAGSPADGSSEAKRQDAR